ncbi:MAG: Cell division protein FtsZ [Candidatus Fermentimicrarchaeum limneticum]|uniref:Cell division protein FtsZ n=1 Tax=Fermentimicrarchaeum limneticum TaxID=2795018 RepID=A0A7D6BBZ3_FERL1|nr:MAG: Cell division protein FtsZ [Candidatus Fermentimicrarchaeum limneticum]
MIEQSFLSKDDEELLKFIESAAPKICVVGSGGAGCNTLNRIFEIGIEGVSTVAMNTDAHHLVKTKADRKLLLGKNTTKGLGAGSNPTVGEEAAKESKEEIGKLLANSQMVFVTCGLGGGTGTGSAHIIAEEAKNLGALTISVVTLPFISEGRVRRQNALEGLNKLKRQVDTVIVIPNDKLLAIVPDLPLNTAFKVADEVLSSSVKGITELITKVGLVNLDFADLRTILKDAGCAVIGFGESNANVKPDERAITAVENALSSPLLDTDISEANKALVNVTGGADMTLREAELVVEELSKRIHPNSHIIWGARVEPDLSKAVMKVLVVIAGAKLPNYEKVEVKPEPPDIDLDSII